MTTLLGGPASGVDERLRVRRARSGAPPVGGPLRWHVGQDGSVELVHRFTTADIDDDALVEALSALIHIGVLTGREDFELAAVRIIESVGADAREGWNAFYDNSVRKLEEGQSAFSPIHRRARSLVVGSSVLEVGSCFGFLALQLAREGHTVAACDLDPGAVQLLRRQARRMGLTVHADVGDAAALPYRDRSTDTVTLIHLLEHLDEEQAVAALRHALRVARRRVIVAVPFEEQPSEHFGHRQALTPETLERWAQRVRHAGSKVFIDHGGWLVLRPEPVVVES